MLLRIFNAQIIRNWGGWIIFSDIRASYSEPDIVITQRMHIPSEPTAASGLCAKQEWHYQHAMYRRMLEEKGIAQSMSRKGNCLDNAVMENFFGIMKSELLYLHKWKSIEQFKSELEEYIHYNNNERIKAKLQGMSPVKYRTHSLQI